MNVVSKKRKLDHNNISNEYSILNQYFIPDICYIIIEY